MASGEVSQVIVLSTSSSMRESSGPYSSSYLSSSNGGGVANIGWVSTSLAYRVYPPLRFYDVDELQRKLRVFARTVLLTSLFFWLWAIYNTQHLQRHGGGFDLGCLSFGGTSVSSLMLLRCANGNRLCKRKEKDDDDEVDGGGVDYASKHSVPSVHLRTFAVATQVAVAANYLLGIVFAFKAGSRVYVYFASYCSVFSLLWIFTSMSTWVMIQLYRESIRQSFGDDMLRTPRRRGCLYWILINTQGIREKPIFGDEQEEDVIDDELRALYEGSRYS